MHDRTGYTPYEGLSVTGWPEIVLSRGRVVVRTCRRDGQALLEVQDNGVGMTEEVIRRCTETHFSTKRDNALFEGHSTGMGLGLSMCRATVERHGGTISCSSGAGEKTRFRIRLPRVE